MKIFARHDLACSDDSPRHDREPALLLEGAWPSASTCDEQWSLDETLDARFEDLDAEAAALAERCAEIHPVDALGLNSAFLHALPLRYYVLRLLRVVAFFFRSRRPTPGEPLIACLEPGRDADYGALLAAIARAQGCELRFAWRSSARASCTATQASGIPDNSSLRRAAGKLAAWYADWRAPAAGDSSPRIVLCGNPRVLDPVCEELLEHSAAVYWLYDRFALGSWRRWHARGVRQLVCDADQQPHARRNATALEYDVQGRPVLRSHGISLDAIITDWLSARRAATEHWTRYFERALAHLRQVRPQAVALDEDATPRARATIAAARRLSIRTCVVQHGVPGVRFGFAPLMADEILAIDEGSRRQFRRWGIAGERIHVTGSPSFERLADRFASLRKAAETRSPSRQTTPSNQPACPTFLLLASTPPRDARPDALTYHLTSQTYERMWSDLRAALARIGRCRLLIKPHPRDPAAQALRAALASTPELTVAWSTESTCEALLQRVDVVLSCASTAGVEAAALGRPVVQLLPRGSGDILRAEDWNLVGSARDEDELARLLPAAVQRSGDNGRIPPKSGDSGSSAAKRIVARLLAPDRPVEIVPSPVLDERFSALHAE